MSEPDNLFVLFGATPTLVSLAVIGAAVALTAAYFDLKG